MEKTKKQMTRKRLAAMLMTLALALCLIIPAANVTWAEEKVWDQQTIKNATDFYDFATLVNSGTTFAGKTITLANDVDLSSYADWIPVGTEEHPFEGTFDGNGKNITGLTITDCTGDFHGLFGYNKGTLKNFTVSGTITSTAAGNYIGSVAGLNAGTISGVTSSVTVDVENGGEQVGGIVGVNTNGTWFDTSNTQKTIEGAAGLIENCANIGNVTGVKQVGGIAGENGATVNACYNSGKVDGTNNSSKNGVGGIAGRNGNNNTAVTVAVISNCYNKGEVGRSGQKWVGGITGFNNAKSSVTNCYNVGNIVKGAKTYNAIVGNQEGSAENNYSLATNSSGTDEKEIGKVKTEAEMKEAGFADTVSGTGSAYLADEDSINDGYPILYWQAKAKPYVTEIKFESDPEKLTYVKGETFDTEGLSIKAVYSDASEVAIDDFDVSKTDALTENCEVTITAELDGVKGSKTYDVKVITGEKLEIIKAPTKTEYAEGEEFDVAGMQVSVLYSDGSALLLEDDEYTCTVSNPLTKNDKTVKVTYELPDGTVLETSQSISVVVTNPVEITEGNDATFNGKKSLSFTFETAMTDPEVYVDGNLVLDTNYTLSEDGTVLKLKKSYLKTLSNGEHSLVVLSDAGEAAGNFTVDVKASADNNNDTNKTANDKTPKTGDESNAFMWIAIMIAAGCGIAVTTASRKRQSR